MCSGNFILVKLYIRENVTALHYVYLNTLPPPPPKKSFLFTQDKKLIILIYFTFMDSSQRVISQENVTKDVLFEIENIYYYDFFFLSCM